MMSNVMSANAPWKPTTKWFLQSKKSDINNDACSGVSLLSELHSLSLPNPPALDATRCKIQWALAGARHDLRMEVIDSGTGSLYQEIGANIQSGVGGFYVTG